MNRLQFSTILADLKKKMVFLVGPRQSGKTWLAKEIAKAFTCPLYLNYDHFEDRQLISNESWLSSTDLLIFDELHKMPDWKNYLKGIFDTKPSTLAILVTGSARLDMVKQVGDSLAGRFFMHRLLPFTPAELAHTKQLVDIERLMTRGGFPEPYLTADEIDAKRWRQQYVDSLIRIDVFDIEQIHNLKAMQLTLQLLRERVGSPISYQSLGEDIGISPNTVKRYIQILEALYIVFKITPFSNQVARSLMKAPKIYFFDMGLVKNERGARLENLVAISLLRHVYNQIDYQGEDCSLHYLRTKDGQEVDFGIAINGIIEQIIEVKSAKPTIPQGLWHFKQQYGFPAILLVNDLKHEKTQEDIAIRRLGSFLQEL